MVHEKNNRGQVTIFIIVGIVIVGIFLLIWFLFPSIRTSLGMGQESPQQYLQNCLDEKVEEVLENVMKQGGSLNPEHYILYNNEKVEYLCYTREYYKTCIMQKPLLKEQIQKEIQKNIEEEANECLTSMKKSFENKGYNVEVKKGTMEVELRPGNLVISLNDSVTLSGADSQRYSGFQILISSEFYDLVSIAESILNFEARYGDSETTVYMDYYRDIKVEKKKLSEGTTIYIITDRESGEKFTFASRSLAWPPGYGLSEINYPTSTE